MWEFESDIIVLQSQTTTIHDGYQPVVHVRSVRQSARITALSSDVVRTGDRGRVRFRFMFRPEVVAEGMRVIFREGRTKGMGVITGVCDAVVGKTTTIPEEHSHVSTNKMQTHAHGSASDAHHHHSGHSGHSGHANAHGGGHNKENRPERTKGEKAAAYKVKR